MPGFESLNDTERWDVVAYAFSLSTSAMDILLGEEIYAGLCVDCHGAEGVGSGSAPAHADPEWIIQYSKNDIVTTIGEGIEPGMPAFSDTLSEAERFALADYIFDLSIPGFDQHGVEEEIALQEEVNEDERIEGFIRGQITNGSEGGVVPKYIEVTLYGFDGQQEAFSETTIANDKGEYQFADVQIQPDRVFITTVEYQGAIYASEIAHFLEDGELDLPITLFETTTDTSNVQVDRIHVIFEVLREGIVQVSELWILSNIGDRTIASDLGDGILTIQLPDGADNPGFESGMLGTRFQVTENGFTDLYPIRPGIGNQEIIFSFNLPFEKSLKFSQPISYPVGAVVLLVPEGIVELKGDGLQDLGIRQTTEGTLHNYGAGPLSPGTTLEVTVKRASGSGLASILSNSSLGIVVGVVLFVIALGGTTFWLYRRKQDAEIEADEFQLTDQPRARVDEKRDDRESILQAIADLDDAYEAGEVETESYAERRENLKAQLMEIMQKAGND